MPDFSLESAHGGLVAGVDEAGRGPWAGPVVAAAVILHPARIPGGINDSKKLSPARRDALYDVILDHAIASGVGIATVEEIDEINILAATMLAMQRAVSLLSPAPTLVLIDGNRAPALPCAVQTVVGGDATSLSIAAASIIAKVTRDRVMAELSRQYPGYGWEKNAGYGTAAHQQCLAERGLTPHHRKSFAPIKALLEKEQARILSVHA